MNLFITLFLLIGTVILGGLIVIAVGRKQNDRMIKLLLAFSGGFLLSIAFIHFIPELYESSEINVGLFILVGFLVQLILEFFSGGLEHGHAHVHKDISIPYGIIAALSFHSLIEGIPLGSQMIGKSTALTSHHTDDNSFLLGILFHHIPVAVALMTLLVSGGVSQIKSWAVLLFFGVMTPIGVLIGMYSGSLFDNFDFDIILAIVVGMFLHISTTIIFETSENHKFNLVKLLSILSGCAIAFTIH